MGATMSHLIVLIDFWVRKVAPKVKKNQRKFSNACLSFGCEKSHLKALFGATFGCEKSHPNIFRTGKQYL